MNFVERKKNLDLCKVPLEFEIGQFTISTVTSIADLNEVFALRYQVFQVESIGKKAEHGLDQDQFDALADHIIVKDNKSQKIVATSRLLCSKFTSIFYSEQEFNITHLLKQRGVKLEIGRVCVHEKYRKGIIILALWRAIAIYMVKVEARYLFGCASVATEDAEQAAILHKYLQSQNKISNRFLVYPTAEYKFNKLEQILEQDKGQNLSLIQAELAQKLLPALCRSYFDIGCFAEGVPAHDKDFKCIDYFTFLDRNELAPSLAKKLFGDL